MSEYWKSTPKYWCKFCETFVKDTPLSKRQHESTGKHQGSVQRSLRNIHKEHEREEREKSRAKAEVERLNGVVAGQRGAGGGVGAAGKRDTGLRPGESERTRVRAVQEVSKEERKRQMQQLAEMGVALPRQYRAEMAMAGEWETVSTRVVGQGGEEGDVKPDTGALSFGVRKRKAETGEDDEGGEEEGGTVAKKRKEWGRDVREFPVAGENGNVDFDALIASGGEPKVEEDEAVSQQAVNLPIKRETNELPDVKKEESEDAPAGPPALASLVPSTAAPVKQEDAPSIAPIAFKKRKPKAAKA